MNSSSNIYSGVLIQFENSVLLCKRQPDGPLGGYWSVPAGMVEEGESPREGAQRELQEETQIEVDAELLQFLSKFESHDGGLFQLYLYESPDMLAPVLDFEHTEWGYYGLRNIENVHICPRLLASLVFWRDFVLEL